VKTVIVGCGRVGATLAELFDRSGHEVIVVDPSTRAFDRLPSSFGGNAVRGDGTDEDTLRRAGAEDADVFLALTEGDNRNVMAAQVATEALGARRVIAKINDPLRASAYAEMGLATLCRTTLQADAVAAFLGLQASGLPGVLPATGSHHGEPHGPHGGSGSAASSAAPTPGPEATSPLGQVVVSDASTTTAQEV
jgi:trk system potassium uptake protein